MKKYRTAVEMTPETADRIARVTRLQEAGQLRRIRSSSGLSLRDIEQVTGFEHDKLSRFERGLRRPRADERFLAYVDWALAQAKILRLKP